MKIPEVTAVWPDEAAKLKITARNVKEAQVSVYKVDLLKFYQNRRNLSDFSEMNLAGIKPIWEGTVDLGAMQFLDKSKIADLPLPGKGAYFVAVKADDGDYAFYRGTNLQRVQSSGGGAATPQQPNQAIKKTFQEQARDAYIGNNAIAQEKQAENYRGLQGKSKNNSQPASNSMFGVAAGQAY